MRKWNGSAVFVPSEGFGAGMRAGDGTNAYAGIGIGPGARSAARLRIRRIDSDLKMRRQIGQR